MKARTTRPGGGATARAGDGLVDRRVCVVDGLVVAVGARLPLLGEPPQVASREPRLHHRRERRRVGRHDQLVAEAPLQPEAGDAEGLVLVVAVTVGDVVGALRDAPGHLPRGAVLELPKHRHAAALREQRLRIAPHDEARHQVFESGAAPRQERRRAADARDEPPQVEPVRFRKLAARDRDEAGEPRLRSQQVVVRRVQMPRALLVREPIADREDPALRVVEEPEAGALGERGGAPSELVETGLVQPFGERHQRSDEVAAVHGRDVAGRQRSQALGVVPVEQMAFVPLEALDRRERRVDPRRELVAADEAEVVSGERRQQPHADVRRRGPVGHPGLRRLLEVVGGQAVVVGSHEGLEVAPGVAGDAREERAVLGGEIDLRLRRRPAEHVRDERRGGPEREHRQRDGPGGGTRQSHQGEAGDRDQRARDHLAHEGARAVARVPALGAGRGRLPLQQPPLRGRQPDQRHADRVHALPGLARGERELQARLSQRGAGVLAHDPQKDTPRLLGRRSRERLERDLGQVEAECRQHGGGPDGRVSRQHRPRQQQQRDGRGCHQAASQVVEDLPARDQRQPVAARAGTGRDERKQPPEDLPVAAHPAMLAARVREDARRVVVDDLDVGDESRARVEPLEEVVGQERVLGHAAVERGHEGVHVVEPLAGEDAFGEEVLVRVGDRGGVGVDARVPGVEPREERARGARHRHAHPGLQDRVALRDTAETRVEPGPVERVGGDADQLLRGVARQARVRVERDAVAHAREDGGVAGLDRETGVRGAAQQAVPFLDLAALALPAHEDALARIPPAHAVHEVEAVVASLGVARVERDDAPTSGAQDGLVLRHLAGGGVREVAQDREMDQRIEVAEREHLEALEQLGDPLDARQERRHHDHRPRVLGHAAQEVEARQPPRSGKARAQALDDGRGHVAGRQQQQQRHPGEWPGGVALPLRIREAQAEQQARSGSRSPRGRRPWHGRRRAASLGGAGRDETPRPSRGRRGPCRSSGGRHGRRSRGRRSRPPGVRSRRCAGRRGAALRRCRRPGPRPPGDSGPGSGSPSGRRRRPDHAGAPPRRDSSPRSAGSSRASRRGAGW